MKKNPTIHLQAVTYNNEPESILKALRGIANAVRVDREQLGIIGNVSVEYGDASDEPMFDEEQVKEIREEFLEWFDFSFRHFGFNTGYGKGHNLMGLDSGADYLVIMNPDILLCNRFFSEMLYPFENPDTGLVEARQTPVEHHKQYDPVTFETDWATGACFMIPAELFKKLRGFDTETFFMYCEDVDLSWRLRAMGYKIIYQPQAPVFHAKRLSEKGGWKPGWAEVFYSSLSAMLMAYKWSNDTRVEKLLRIKTASPDKVIRESAEEFLRMRNENRLPEQIDPEHRIGRFVGDYYSDNRYTV